LSFTKTETAPLQGSNGIIEMLFIVLHKD